MFAFAFSIIALCIMAGLLQFWSARRWLDLKPLAYSVVLASVAAALLLQGLTAALTLLGLVDPHTNFLSYFYSYGFISPGGALIAILAPLILASIIALIPAIAVASARPEIHFALRS